MTVSINYNLAGLHEASKFIWEKNLSVKNWPDAPQTVFDVMSSIHASMTKGAMENASVIRREHKLSVKLDGEWLSYTGTGGYYFLFDLQSEEDSEEIVIGVTILVDPSVSHPMPGFVTEEIDGTVETV